MKLDRGFRVPEPRDRYIRWPARGQATEIMAVFDRAAAAWLVPGVERAYGSALELVQRYGNDWYVLWVDRAAEADTK